MNTQEITIPVPWGHISAKVYGNETNPAVLCVHGIQDNCDTFFKLMPLLPTDYYYICIDLPGHGLSAHFPQHVPLEFINYLSVIKLIRDHFNWSQFVYLGHSFGGQLGSWFTSTYPEYIKCLIVLDTMGPRSVDCNITKQNVRTRIDDFQALQSRQKGRDPPVYTYNQAIEKIKSSRPSKLTDESVHILAKRSLIKVNNESFKFSYDQRLKLQIHPLMTFDQQKNILSHLSCPILFVLADENCGRYSNYLKNAYEFYSTHPKVTINYVNGDHSVHLNYPDRVFTHILKFLKQYY
ncbi:serine hydrolase-like protein isoform X3 [Daktulosphaira vitifoliae]|uniref:serine hydrolase-like protein isoform X3 n=1 Tax=Daktulosphaira vitifoliae TaxID=58002 RepID=UPI0021AA5264|nr:serine hydrolase-like protein isoform X3 [Daktulosphaira vitifoliae]